MQPESHSTDRQDLPEAVFKCDAFEQQMHDLLDDRRVPEDHDGLRSQATLSTEHQQLLSGQQLMLEGLELAELPELPDDFAERCVAAAVAEGAVADSPVGRATVPSNSRRANWRFVVFTAVCAAAVLIAAVPFWNWLSPTPGQPSIAEGPAEVLPPVEELVDADGNSVPGTPIEDELQDSATPDPQSPTSPEEPELYANDSLPDGPRPPEDTEKPYQDLVEVFRDLRQRLPASNGEENLLALRPQWVDDMAGGFRPVADSVGGAFNALRRNIPPSTKGEPSDKPQARLPRFGGARHVS
jgi:hypothetical protein